MIEHAAGEAYFNGDGGDLKTVDGSAKCLD